MDSAKAGDAARNAAAGTAAALASKPVSARITGVRTAFTQFFATGADLREDGAKAEAEACGQKKKGGESATECKSD